MADYLRRTLDMTELCQVYGISRQMGYKWIGRYVAHGPQGLADRSRRPDHDPNQTARERVEALLQVRQQPPTWGAKQRLAIVEKRHPAGALPGRATVCGILNRQGLVPKQRRWRRVIGRLGKPAAQRRARNATGCADCKGQFTTGDGSSGDPLLNLTAGNAAPLLDTVTAGYSRDLLGCQGLLATRAVEAKPVFTRLFKELGLPQRIRREHGAPCATPPLARRSTRSAWWVRRGILPALIEPDKPRQNGRHARMQRSLQVETTRPPAANRRAQQRQSNCFQKEFNAARPHAALDMATLSSVYVPSPREMPDRLPPLAYPDRCAVRYVSYNGGSRWHKGWGSVSITCAGEYVGLEEIDAGGRHVYFGPRKRGRLWERHMPIEDAYARLKRRR